MGKKPDIIISNLLENEIKVINEECCLVYDCEINDSNLIFKDLTKWWGQRPEGKLLDRMKKSIEENTIEKRMFNIYYTNIYKHYNGNLPSLIPQVYLHYDPKTAVELHNKKRLINQRMDFLILVNGHRIIIELDGKHHYSIDEKASVELYSQLVSYDRDMKLLGYDIYRFGGFEFTKDDIKEKIISFFKELIEKYW